MCEPFCGCGLGSVVGIATGYGLDGPGIEHRWGRDRPRGHPASYTMGTGSFPGVNSGGGVTLTPHPLLVPWSRKSRAITLLPLCAVRPVQSLCACARVHFTLPYTLWLPQGVAEDQVFLWDGTLCSVPAEWLRYP